MRPYDPLFWLAVAILIQICAASSLLSPQSILQPEDRTRLESILSVSEDELISEQSLVTFHQKLTGLNVLYSGNLNAPISSKRKQFMCEQIAGLLQSPSVQSSIESLYYATSIHQLLACPALASADLIVTKLEAAQNAETSIDDLWRSSFALLHLNKRLASQKLASFIQNALKKNDTLLAHGLAFQLAARLTPVDSVANSLIKRVPDIVSQADLVDSRMLQFEGGLGVTATVLNGIYSLAQTIQKAPLAEITKEQTAKFTHYLISRRTVQTVKGASELLQVLNLLSQNKFHVPVLVAPAEGSVQISSSNPVFSVRVTNTLGHSLNRVFSVQVRSTKEGATKSIRLEPVQGDSTLYAGDLYSTLKSATSRHELIVQVEPIKPDPSLVLPIENHVQILIQDPITLEDVEIAVGEKDQLALRYETVAYPARLSRPLEVDHTQKIGIQFRVANQQTHDYILPQQVFLQFRRRADGRQVTFVADFERSTATYRTTISMVTRAKDFDYASGSYDLFVLAGDSSASNAIVYHLAEVQLDLPTELAPQVHVKPWLRAEFSPLPELLHTFRPSEKRPAVIVSQVFTLLVLAPLVLLLIIWCKIGVNLRAFRFTASAFLFHSSLALVFTLYTLFFWYLNMFTTIKCLSGVLVLAFLSGHRLLSSLANGPNSKSD